MESNGERLADIEVSHRGEHIHIKKVWKATTPGAEVREEVQKGRFMAPNGDMWFLIHLDAAYDRKGKDRIMLGIREHWKVLAPKDLLLEEKSHWHTHEIKHIHSFIPKSAPSDAEKWDELILKAREALKEHGIPFPTTREGLDELGRLICRWESAAESAAAFCCESATANRQRPKSHWQTQALGKSLAKELEELSRIGGLRPECYGHSAEAWARLQALAMRESWPELYSASESSKRSRKD